MNTLPLKGSSISSLFKTHPWLPMLFLITATTAAYANSFGVPFVFDDVLSIPSNPSIRSWSTALFPPGDFGLTVGGRPVLNITFAMNYMVGGNHVVGYHLVNLALHVLASFLLWGVVTRTLQLGDFDSRMKGHAFELGFCTAILWSLHPLQTESVTYIVQRAESLSGLLFLATAYCFIRAVSTEGRQAIVWQSVSVFVCLLGMGAKETMVSAPILVLLYDRTFCSGTILTSLSKRKWYYIGLAMTWGMLAYCVFGAGGRAATAGFQLGVSWWDYLLTQCYAHARYLVLFIWPNGQTFDYGRLVVTELAGVFLQGLMLCTAAFWSLYAIVKKPRLGLLGFAYFSLHAPTTLVPVVTQTIAEHRMYLPLAFLVLSVVLAGFRWLGDRIVIPFVVLGLVWGGLSYLRNNDYQTADRLWQDTVAKVPKSHRAWHSIGQLQLQRKEWALAEATLKHSIELRPGDTMVEQDYATVLIAQGKMQEALAVYEGAVNSLPEDFSHAHKLREDLALLLEQVGRVDEAISQLHLALKTSPEKQRVRTVLGHALARAGRKQEAVEQFDIVMQSSSASEGSWIEYAMALVQLGDVNGAVNLLGKGMQQLPDSLELKRSYGSILQSANRNDESILVLQECLKSKPGWGEALFNLGMAKLNQQQGAEAEKYFMAAEKDGITAPALQAAWGRAALGQGREEEAIKRLTKAVDSMVLDWENRYILANLLLSHGAAEKAVGHYEKVVARNPGHVNAHNELGVAYLELGRKADARREFETALKLQPSNEDALGNLKDLDAQL